LQVSGVVCVIRVHIDKFLVLCCLIKYWTSDIIPLLISAFKAVRRFVYITNVASSEIYPTWPYHSLRANIHAQISIALNRVFTEWYRGKGYNFDITNSTQYDQYFVENRNIYDSVSRVVDEIFNTYVIRPPGIEPYYTEEKVIYPQCRKIACGKRRNKGNKKSINMNPNHTKTPQTKRCFCFAPSPHGFVHICLCRIIRLLLHPTKRRIFAKRVNQHNIIHNPKISFGYYRGELFCGALVYAHR